MTGRDLAAEYAAALRGTRYADIAPLMDFPGQSRAERGQIIRGIALAFPAISRIVVENSLYQPDPDGGVAYIIPVRQDFPETPETASPLDAIANGAIIDLLAFHPSRPRRWALRRGVAYWLGAVEPQLGGGSETAPAAVWRTPLGWLYSGCSGIVMLTGDPWLRYSILIYLDAIVAEDERHAADLRQILEHPRPAPPVLVRGARRAA